MTNNCGEDGFNLSLPCCDERTLRRICIAIPQCLPSKCGKSVQHVRDLASWELEPGTLSHAVAPPDCLSTAIAVRRMIPVS